MNYPKRYIKKSVNRVYIKPQVLFGYLPVDMKEAICNSLEVETLEDDSLLFDYDLVQDCFSVSKSFEFAVTVKDEV